jgi:hypothetical protein
VKKAKLGQSEALAAIEPRVAEFADLPRTPRRVREYRFIERRGGEGDGAE